MVLSRSTHLTAVRRDRSRISIQRLSLFNGPATDCFFTAIIEANCPAAFTNWRLQPARKSRSTNCIPESQLGSSPLLPLSPLATDAASPTATTRPCQCSTSSLACTSEFSSTPHQNQQKRNGRKSTWKSGFLQALRDNAVSAFRGTPSHLQAPDERQRSLVSSAAESATEIQ